MRKLLIVQKGAKVIMLPEFTRTLAPNSADGFSSLQRRYGTLHESMIKICWRSRRLRYGWVTDRERSSIIFLDQWKALQHLPCHWFSRTDDIKGRGGCIFVKSIVRQSYDYEEHRNLTPGVDLRIFDTPMWKIGLGLCCDIRCQLLAQIYCQIGCKLLL